MQLPLQITIRDIPHSAVLESHIYKKAQKLNQIYQRIISCRVIVELAEKHHRQGKLFSVHVDVAVPGEALPVTKNSNQDVYIVLRDAFADARRRLEEYAERQKGDGKAGHFLKLPAQGKIVRIFSDQGFGFIEKEDGDEVYFHHSVVKPSLEHLIVGAPVHFLEEMGEKGPQASRVRLSKLNGHGDVRRRH